MRLPNHRERTSVGFNMTPLIDVVFLLIIFFLVSTHLARQEVELGLQLPSATTGNPNPAERRLIINVRQDGAMIVSGQTLTVEELKMLLAGQKEDVTEANIRSDGRTIYRHVQPIMAACAEFGIWNVTFAVTNPVR